MGQNSVSWNHLVTWLRLLAATTPVWNDVDLSTRDVLPDRRHSSDGF